MGQNEQREALFKKKDWSSVRLVNGAPTWMARGWALDER
jgi:hypothetical protein